MRHISMTLAVAILCPAAALAGDLTVKIQHVRSDRGSILAALYDSEASFMNQPSARATFKVKAAKGEVQYVFHDLPPGQYALSVFHDENDNGRLDKNFLGFPKEGYGFSSDSKGSGGPPAFIKAAFQFSGANQSMTVTLQY
jgi:uncharacterized protein (DUF2141 family)